MNHSGLKEVPCHVGGEPSPVWGEPPGSRDRKRVCGNTLLGVAHCVVLGSYD